LLSRTWRRSSTSSTLTLGDRLSRARLFPSRPSRVAAPSPHRLRRPQAPVSTLAIAVPLTIAKPRPRRQLSIIIDGSVDDSRIYNQPSHAAHHLHGGRSAGLAFEQRPPACARCVRGPVLLHSPSSAVSARTPPFSFFCEKSCGQP
jgi:hypothetical protein